MIAPRASGVLEEDDEETWRNVVQGSGKNFRSVDAVRVGILALKGSGLWKTMTD